MPFVIFFFKKKRELEITNRKDGKLTVEGMFGVLAATYTYGDYAMQVHCIIIFFVGTCIAKSPSLSPFLLLFFLLTPNKPHLQQGSWSDGASLGPGPMASFDGQGSGSAFYGVSPRSPFSFPLPFPLLLY